MNSDTAVGRMARRLRVLLVEDRPDTLAAMARLLARTYAVVTADSCAAALAAAARTPVDVVVADIELPDCTGFDLLRDLRAAHGDVPAVAVTGHLGLVERCLAAGFRVCLEKPVPFADIKAAIDAVARS